MQLFTQHEGVAVALRVDDRPSTNRSPSLLPANLTSPALGLLICQLLPYAADAHEKPQFILNQAPYRQASILLAGCAFGAGAVPAGTAHQLGACGVRVVIAPSFGNDFLADCLRQGLLAVALPNATVARLMATADELAGEAPLLIDLTGQHIFSPLNAPIGFALAPTVKIPPVNR